MPPTELTQSTATLKLAALMASISTNSSDKTLWICSCRYCFCEILPSSSTGEKENSAVSASVRISSPSAALRNSPSWLSSFKAFHCLGLWLAVMIIPPAAISFVTAISVVGVVAMPISVTSQPMPMSVPMMMRCTISPEIRASRPTTMRGLLF